MFCGISNKVQRKAYNFVFIKWNWANEAEICKGARMTLNYVMCACMDKTSENEYYAIWLQVTMYNVYGNSSIQRVAVFLLVRRVLK